MSPPILPVLLGSQAGRSQKPNVARGDLDQSPRPQDVDLDSECPKGHLSIVARSETETLTFCSLQKKVKNNELDDVKIFVDQLTDAQKEALLVRATPLTVMLDGFAEILKSIQVSPKGSEFDLSYATDEIDYFVSHAWATSRWLKLVALLYFQNFRAACAANFVAGVCGYAICRSLRDSHADGQHLPPEQFKAISAILMMVLPAVAFCFVLVFGARLPGRHIPSVFLDKVCIHQTNKDLKLLGINGLDVFVRKSRRLLVLYDSDTYQRMWCAYETAMFAKGDGATMKNYDDLCFVPVCAALWSFSTTILPMLAFPLGFLIWELSPADPAIAFWHFCDNQTVGWSVFGLGAYSVVTYIPEAYCVRRCVVDFTTLADTLNSFDMNATKCMQESDRLLVNAKIVEAWGSVENFNEFVRVQAAQSVARACGGVNYTPLFYAKAWIFTWYYFWLSLNSTEYGDGAFGGITFALVVVGMCTFRRIRLGCLAHSWLPTNPILCCGMIAVMISLSCLLHTYAHNTLWWMTHRIVDEYELPVSGGLLFLPVFTIELWFLYLHIRLEQIRSMRLHVWNRLDTLYYAALATICLILVGVTNIMEAVDEKNVLS